MIPRMGRCRPSAKLPISPQLSHDPRDEPRFRDLYEASQGFAFARAVALEALLKYFQAAGFLEPLSHRAVAEIKNVPATAPKDAVENLSLMSWKADGAA